MTLTTTVVRLRLVLEDENLLVLALRLNLARHLRALDERTADLDGIAVNNRQNLIERHALALFGAELLDADDITLGNAVLLASGLDNSVHENTSLRVTRRLRYGKAVSKPRRAVEKCYAKDAHIYRKIISYGMGNVKRFQ